MVAYTPNIEILGQRTIVVVILSFVLLLSMLVGLIIFAHWRGRKRGSTSPYTKQPMSLGVDIAVSIQTHIEGFMASLPQPENEPFDLKKSAVCRETGRIFPQCVTPAEYIHLKWDFLHKRYPGKYVSWGSLTETEKATIRVCHESLEGFQTEISCPKPLPNEIDPYYAVVKPGPLYVDLSSKILLGWKVVPGTEFEVLVVQKPHFETVEDTI